MASGDFRDLTEAQRETARSLATLVSDLRRSSRQGDLARLTAGVALDSSAGNELQARVSREIAPLSGSRTGSAASDGLVAPTQNASEVERSLSAVRETIRELGSSLGTTTKDLERSLAGFSGGLQGLLTGAVGGGGGGGFGGFLKSGFGLAGLGLKIAGLLGNKSPEATVFEPFELPSSLAVEAASTSDVLSGFPRFDRGQTGDPRSFRGDGTAAASQIVVNVNALDSQSFMDRSSDIARAVRDAMLHMHPINDVIGEL